MLQPSGAIALPWPLQARIEALALGFLRPAGSPAIDFAAPEGEPALIPPESISWRVFKNPVSLFIGGVAAVIMELAEPRVREGVWQHSSFRTDALARLQRTGLAAMLTVYGPRSRAETMIAGVVRRHAAVNGTTPEGERYDANDQDLLDWVQATTGFGFIGAYSAYVQRLSGAEFDRAYAEAGPAAALYGAHGAPRSRAEFDMLFRKMEGRLAPSPVIDEFLAIMARVPAFPAPARPLQRLLIKAAIALLPQVIRDRLGLGASWSLRPWERTIVHLAAAGADRLILRNAPAVQACRRLWLPDDYLYRR